MISKSSLGVLLAFAVLGLVVSALMGEVFPQRVTKSQGSPWGTISAMSASADHASSPMPVAVAQVSQILRLAPQAAAQTTAPQVIVQQVAAPGTDVPSPAMPDPVRTVAIMQPPPATLGPSSPMQATRPELVSVNTTEVAKADATAVASAEVEDPQSQAKGHPSVSIDINRAPVEVLNHLPGMGRIGKTIVRHRPYRSIQDLVDRRVLRMSAFLKVKSMIKAD